MASSARVFGIRHNSLFGVLGFLIPTAVTLVAYPTLLHRLGLSAFGVFLLATSVTSALGFLDLRISLATLRYLAADLDEGLSRDAGQVIAASLIFYLALGSVFASFFWTGAPWLAAHFGVEPAMRIEAIQSFRLAALQVPIAFLLALCNAVFKGMQRFHFSTAAASLTSVLTFGGAIVAVRFAGAGLVTVTAISLVASIVVLIGSTFMAMRLLAQRGVHPTAARPTLLTFRRLLGFGSLMSINSISALLLYYLQRFLVGAWIGPAAVAIYQTASMAPYKIHLANYSLTEILFPLSSSSIPESRLRDVYRKMMLASLILALTGTVLLSAFAPQILDLWLGHATAVQVLPPFRIFVAAYFFLALSPAPYHLLNGLGRPQFNAAFEFSTALINLLAIGLLWGGGMTLVKFAWAFVIANLLKAFVYQYTVEVLVWRRWLSGARTSEPARL